MIRGSKGPSARREIHGLRAERVWYVVLSALAVVVAVIGLSAAASVSPSYCGACHRTATDSLRESAHADTGCDSCHASSDPIRLIEDRLRVASMIPAAAWPGSMAIGGRVDDQACLDCHAAGIDRLVTVRGIRMDHRAPTDEGWSCTRCHGDTGHGTQSSGQRRYTMDDCLECHHATSKNISGCDICHEQGGPDREREAVTPWRVTHGSNWRQTHGMGRLENCSACHSEGYCVSCHGMPLPHEPGFLSDHGEMVISLGGRDKCLDCHTSAMCEGCHGGVEMPHPAAFLDRHSELVEEAGEEPCLRCHEESSCDGCHTRHTHPGLTEDQIRALRARPIEER